MAQFSTYPRIPGATVGQKLMSQSAPVVIASDQSAIHTIVDSSALPAGSATAAKQDTGNTSLASIDSKLPANLTVTSTRLLIDGSGVTQPVSGTFWQATQPVSATALPLPAGASTAADQTTGNTSLASIDSKLPASLTVSSTRLLVDGSGVTQPVSATALPLPTGAASEATLSAQSAKLPATLGQHAMAASMSVAIASDQSVIPSSQSGTWTVQPGNVPNTTAWLVRQAGKSIANAPLRNDYSVTNVTTGAYVQLVASTTSLTSEIEIFDSSGQTLSLAVGGAGSEVDQIHVFPGGNGRVPLAIPAGSRVSIKAVSALANTGEININFYT